MKTERKDHYAPQKSPDGTDVYCPLDSESVPEVDTAGTSEECVEKDVVERYSGNIDIQD
jgi:hypothetical protein